MKNIILILPLVAIAQGSFLPIDLTNETSYNIRIVGGQQASEGQFPHQVSLREPTIGHICGGSILNTRWILTAAHCTSGITISSIVVGTTRINSGGTQYRPQQVINHEGYIGEPQLLNDISLVQTATAIAFSQNVQAIRLASRHTSPGAQVVVSGFGATVAHGVANNELLFVNVKAISNEQCAQYTGKQIPKTQLCTYLQPGKGVCGGDSGGPLVEGGELVGVVSWGYPCATGKPDGFTRVSPYISWIQSKIR